MDNDYVDPTVDEDGKAYHEMTLTELRDAAVWKKDILAMPELIKRLEARLKAAEILTLKVVDLLTRCVDPLSEWSCECECIIDGAKTDEEKASWRCKADNADGLLAAIAALRQEVRTHMTENHNEKETD
jgi:hypothetical protein